MASIDAAFQAYADRGVFRGFSASDRADGCREYRFTWLTRRPMRVRFFPARRVIVFSQLFPAVLQTPGVALALKESLAQRLSTQVPAHRRLDSRRATIKARIVSGSLSLSVIMRTTDGTPIVRSALSIVNDLFQVLYERYPDYLSAAFGVVDE